jgi:hypothetical protein
VGRLSPAGWVAIWAIGSVCSIPASGQTGTISVDGNTYSVVLKFDKRVGPGPAQQAGGLDATAPTGNANLSGGLNYYTANYASFGRAYPFNIVGTDPALGAATTTIPTVIVPIKLTFPSSRVLDGTNQVVSTQNSPLFLTADYTTGGTDVGVTQYGDAIQRAEFWNLPGFSQGRLPRAFGRPDDCADRIHHCAGFGLHNLCSKPGRQLRQHVWQWLYWSR